MKIPFDIKYREKIESGEYKVETRSGKTARVVCWDRLGTHLVVLVGKAEYVLTYNPDGTTGQQMSLPSDLFLVTPEPEMSEFEKKLSDVFGYAISMSVSDPQKPTDEFVREYAPELLSIAREQFIKDGYVIEKKAFHDAVKNISDKHLAEMSVEYSIHCKVEDGTRHAVMNWEAFQKVAQKFIDIGKAEALKDMPRWEKCNPNTIYGTKCNLIVNGIGRYIILDGYMIDVDRLEKLPGFKED